MGMKFAPASLHWSQSIVPHSPSSSQTLASAISSPRRSLAGGEAGGALSCRYVSASSSLGGAHQPSKLYHTSRSHSNNKIHRARIIRRALTASLDSSFSDEDFSKQIQELTLRFHLEVAENDNETQNQNPFFHEPDEIIERKANSVEIPLSLRMIKRKKQKWQEGIVEAGESARCSVKKAFSSMVFIVRELQSYTLHLREILYYEDLQGIIANVQKEMHASFVWLFQTVFSHTPTLMMHLMILLANYSVYSMSTNTALAAPVYSTEQVLVIGDYNSIKNNNNNNTSIVRAVKLSSLNGNTASVGGNNGSGGGKCKPVASGTEGDGSVNYDRTITPSSISTNSPTVEEEEETLWDSIVGEASKMGGGSLDRETLRGFVSPVDARIESDDQTGHLKTELLYQTELDREPNNPLLLANYAQFLYLVAQDFDRAEKYFKRASEVEPKDAEALNKYATFLWAARNDLWAAEETYLEAISTEPENSYYAANYAHFLWNTGGEDTCFPLDSPDSL